VNDKPPLRILTPDDPPPEGEGTEPKKELDTLVSFDPEIALLGRYLAEQGAPYLSPQLGIALADLGDALEAGREQILDVKMRERFERYLGALTMVIVVNASQTKMKQILSGGVVTAKGPLRNPPNAPPPRSRK